MLAGGCGGPSVMMDVGRLIALLQRAQKGANVRRLGPTRRAARWRGWHLDSGSNAHPLRNVPPLTGGAVGRQLELAAAGAVAHAGLQRRLVQPFRNHACACAPAVPAVPGALARLLTLGGRQMQRHRGSWPRPGSGLLDSSLACGAGGADG